MLKLTGKRPLLAIRIKDNHTHSYLSDLEPGNNLILKAIELLQLSASFFWLILDNS